MTHSPVTSHWFIVYRVTFQWWRRNTFKHNGVDTRRNQERDTHTVANKSQVCGWEVEFSGHMQTYTVNSVHIRAWAHIHTHRESERGKLTSSCLCVCRVVGSRVERSRINYTRWFYLVRRHFFSSPSFTSSILTHILCALMLLLLLLLVLFRCFNETTIGHFRSQWVFTSFCLVCSACERKWITFQLSKE